MDALLSHSFMTDINLFSFLLYLFFLDLYFSTFPLSFPCSPHPISPLLACTFPFSLSPFPSHSCSASNSPYHRASNTNCLDSFLPFPSPLFSFPSPSLPSLFLFVSVTPLLQFSSPVSASSASHALSFTSPSSVSRTFYLYFITHSYSTSLCIYNIHSSLVVFLQYTCPLHTF